MEVDILRVFAVLMVWEMRIVLEGIGVQLLQVLTISRESR